MKNHLKSNEYENKKNSDKHREKSIFRLFFSGYRYLSRYDAAYAG